ncbi:ABC transporter permease/substrate-binding protein [Clostridium septicum]|uniref:ABC transporter permease/substrate-binding protein n=1 Tax=Clostridium septicum TaxID=1504 RepID=A0ABY5AYW8_CLOSE|nr:ABC transporter permease/substrate-binding protein [Clostridium septicum]MDU1313519.1 ABC transporter permease/substrate-binding protein [Clostridium septicum]UEC21286.1 ABC transporter permease/substrate-binding protein [Clostridium septicum]USS00670.1 ABC transporter permease/substrate-binding protein [Clostridium septicum]WLF69213.1 ABC transporter permease/substrate-binding protein [Clostridium septicum]
MNIIFEVFNLYKERFDFFLELLIQHIVLSFIAIIIITILGMAIGIYITKSKKIADIVLGTVNFLYTIPSIALFGFLVAISGIGNVTALIALVIYGLMPIIKNTYAGINEVDAQIVESAIAMGSTKSQLLWKVKVPLALPVIITGFRTMVVMTIALGGIASFIGAGGLGVAIWRGITTNNPAMTIAGSLLVAILSVLSDFLIGKLDIKVSNRVNGIRDKNKVSKKNLIIGTAIFASICIIIGILEFTTTGSKVVVASKPQTEGYILAEMISQLIEENTDINVERKFGIGGGTSNIHPAMLKGEIDIYPEYTGTARLFVLKKDIIEDKDELYKSVKEDYMKEYNINWLGTYGFNNTFTLALKKELAKKLEVESFSDLANISSELAIGSEYDFYEREDGYKGLEKIYGFKFKNKKDIDIGLKYEAISKDKVDVINAFSTDALIKEYDLKLLHDDKGFFPSYYGATLIRQEILDKYPELESILRKLDNEINNEEMIDLNYEVDKEGKEPKAVAREFLKRKGLL